MFRCNRASVWCCSAQQLVIGRVVTSKLFVTQVNVLKSCCGLSCNECNNIYIVNISYQFLFQYVHNYIPLLHGKQFSCQVHLIPYPLIQIT